MHSSILSAILLVGTLTQAALSADRELNADVTYKRMCDASAAVALSPERFVVASDEGAKLRIYRYGQEQPEVEQDLADFLDLEGDPEADLEGAAWVGERIYWIGSHGRNSDGDKQPNRRRLFATKAIVTEGKARLEFVGEPYKHLLRDLKSDSRFDRFHLDAAAELAAESPNGLNIEGLSSTPDGDVLIGFRNPLPQGKALLVSLTNPHKVLEGKVAEFGDPILLDVGHRGIRSLEYWAARRMYLIIAGPFDNDGDFALYQWSGRPDDSPTVVEAAKFRTLGLDDLHPEALFVRDDASGLIQIFSDDGDRHLSPGEKKCKKLDPSNQLFRSLFLRW